MNFGFALAPYALRWSVVVGSSVIKISIGSNAERVEPVSIRTQRAFNNFLSSAFQSHF